MERKDMGRGSGATTSAVPSPKRLSEELEGLIEAELKEVHPRLLRAVRRLTRNAALAEDITQEACIAVILEYRKGTVFEQPVIVFATVVARNKLKSHYKRLGTQNEDPTAELPEGAPWPARPAAHHLTASLEFLELLAAVKAAIGHERQYTIWELTHVWGLSGIEIAAHLNVSPATVSKDLKKATQAALGIGPEEKWRTE
jgi:RNA polymerase sigma factor (sigma-70 family)